MPNPALNPAVLLSPVEDGYVAYDPLADRLHELNPTGALLAELCDGSRSVAEIRDLAEPFLPAASGAAVDRWIDEGVAAGLLAWSDSPLAAHRELSAKELADLAVRLREQGKVQTAFLCRKRAAELIPEDAKAWHALGEVAHIVGRRDAARMAYERYLALRPDDAEIRHIVAALRDEAPPPRVPDECIQQLYKRFSSFYEINMREELGYEGPERLFAAVKLVCGERHDLAILDLGCGSGLAGACFKPWAAQLTGIDLSPEMIGLARGRNIYDRLETAEVSDWLARDAEPFDLIVVCDTLIYFGDLSPVMAACFRRLKRGGILALTVERGAKQPFRLTDSGRYAHHPQHIRDAAAAVGFAVARLDEAHLRMEYGAKVIGLYAVLTK